MGRSSKRNFWDNSRRIRNAQKPNYWEKWQGGWEPQERSPRPDEPTRSRICFTQVKPTAAEARAFLKANGLKGNKLSSLVRAIMKGEISMAWVECNLLVEELKSGGFTPVMPPETRSDGQTVFHFERRTANGDLEDFCTLCFSKKA